MLAHYNLISLSRDIDAWKWGTTNHLLGNHDHSLDGKASVAVVEEILERRTQEIDDEDVVKTLLAKVVHIGNAGYPRTC